MVALTAVVGFGVVSLAGDMVYEGARSVTGPLLASLGATAVLVGLVTGAGEAAALVLRLVFGPLADRSGRYRSLTLAGYGLTAVCVPLLAVTPFIGAAGLAVACSLLLAERTGKDHLRTLLPRHMDVNRSASSRAPHPPRRAASSGSRATGWARTKRSPAGVTPGVRCEHPLEGASCDAHLWLPRS